MMMRIVAVVLAMVMLAGAAHAQAIGGNGGARKQHQQRTDESDSQKTKADDKAYNAALKSLPDKPFDPWRNVR
jgi:Ni/Co efflux regulator RcnB